MATWLKQSTAIDVSMGPFLDSADGSSVESALTITAPDIRLKKNGGAWAQKNAAQTLSHEENGWYEVALDTTDTNTLGNLLIAIHESGALPVWREFQVVPANVWDSFFGADKLQVHADEITAGLITAAAVATGAIDADAIAADAVTEIQSGLSTLDAAGVRSAVGLASANMDTQLSNIANSVATLGPAIDAVPTAAENAIELLDQAAGVETNRTLRQTLRLMLATLCGKASGMATTTATFRDTNDSKDRVVATVDSDGNRTALTLDAS